MALVGEATVLGTSLEASAHGVTWHITIRRADGRSDARFTAYNAKPMSAEDVSKFIPNWRALVWRRIEDSMFSRGKSQAEAPDYQIAVAGTRDSLLSHEAVIGAFEEFMATSGQPTESGPDVAQPGARDGRQTGPKTLGPTARIGGERTNPSCSTAEDTPCDFI